jgi:hypothetical protein
MLVIRTHEEDPGTQATTIRLWEWENRLPLPPVTTMEESPSDLMNTATMTNACTSATNATTTGVEEEHQQQQQQQLQTTPTIPAPLLE